jgi:group II intron reverse transcriptase/maturase
VNGGVRTIHATDDINEKAAQFCVLHFLQSIFEHTFEGTSYGYRIGRQPHLALISIEEAIKEGKMLVIKLDIKNCFDNLPRKLIINQIKEITDDPQLLQYIQSVMSTRYRDSKGKIIRPRKGVPQGTVLAPILCNICLDKLDKQVSKICPRVTYIRYADDLLIIGRSKRTIMKAKAAIKGFINDRLHMTLKEEKEVVVDLNTDSITFLGFSITVQNGQCVVMPKPKALKKVRTMIDYDASTDERNTVVPKLIGWAGYFCINEASTSIFIETVERSGLDNITKEVIKAKLQCKSVQAP